MFILISGIIVTFYVAASVFFGTLFFAPTFPLQSDGALVIVSSVAWPFTMPVYLAWSLASFIRRKATGD